MKLGLGTVQFGLDYGISNQAGKVSAEEVNKILTIATANKMQIIDTAALYGDSEEILGQNLPPENDFLIVTKAAKFGDKSMIDEADTVHLRTVFLRSLALLKQKSIYGLLIHQMADLFKKGGELLIAEMIKLKKEGLVKKIGVSVYNAEQIDKVLDNYTIDLIQLPFNVFDQRLLQSGHLQKLKQQNIEIHARSAFLQGLLLMPSAAVPGKLQKYINHLQLWESFCQRYSVSKLYAALRFVLQTKEIDKVIVGTTSAIELQQVCEVANVADDFNADFSALASNAEELINPSLWAQ